MSSRRWVPLITPHGFKGIAVFTPGGDLVYCRDEQKQAQWHLNLCGALHEQLGLVESPHFLVPCFTATVDCWVDPQTRSPRILAEAYPWVHRYQGLLNAIFGLGDIEWQRLQPPPEHRSPSVFETYRSRFPQLWEHHNLVLDISSERAERPDETLLTANPSDSRPSGTVLRLFVSGHSVMTEQILKTLQGVLESSRHRAYTLQMVDVSKDPAQAETDQISATPTLIRVWPHPVRRLVGELDNPNAILSLLSD